MAFPSGTAYHADSDADDEYERSVMTSPTQLHTDSEASPTDSEPPSTENTPTTYGNGGDDHSLPRTIITEWTLDECAQFIASLGLGQYCDSIMENEIVGEALIALRHDELKEMGIISVGHRLTILKNVYDVKIQQDIPIDQDHYIPLTEEQSAQNEPATKADIQRWARSIINLRDDRLRAAEDQLRELTEAYNQLRQELFPVFKLVKERLEPLPNLPGNQRSTQSPEMGQEMQPAQEKGGLIARKLSTSRGRFFGSNPKNHSPTHIPSTIQEGKTLADLTSLDPSAAALAASNTLNMSHSALPTTNSPSAIPQPSPTSPMPYPPQLLPNQTYHEPQTATRHPLDYADSIKTSRPSGTPTPGTHRGEPPNSAASINSARGASTFSTAATVIPSSSHPSMTSLNGSATPMTSRHFKPTTTPNPSTTTLAPSTSASGSETPSVEIFKSFRVGFDDPCHKVLPHALQKYNIQADWRHYALYIVYGDQERCVDLHEKPLALFKDLDREGKKPMFMLRKLAAPQGGGGASVPGGVL